MDSDPEEFVKSITTNLLRPRLLIPLLLPLLCLINANDVNATVNERPKKPFKYDLIEHLKHIVHS